MKKKSDKSLTFLKRYRGFLKIKNIFILFFFVGVVRAEQCVVNVHPCSIRGCDKKELIEVSVKVQDESRKPYSRQEFLSFIGGRSWGDEDGDCKDTRTEVLEETSLIPVVYSSTGCAVDMGLWYDPYSDITFEDPRQLDIDHFIPIKEAYESGALHWSPERRAEFANNYLISANLIPVWNSVNRSKGASEPQEWLPPHKGYMCEYLNRWTYVKWYSGLTMDEAECKSIKNKLMQCGIK